MAADRIIDCQRHPVVHQLRPRPESPERCGPHFVRRPLINAGVVREDSLTPLFDAGIDPADVLALSRWQLTVIPMVGPKGRAQIEAYRERLKVYQKV